MKHVREITILLVSIFLSLGFLFATNVSAAQSVLVGNVEQLYSAVNDPANARSNPLSAGAPGANNHVTVEIKGAGNGKGHWQPLEFFADSIPTDPNTTNSVTVDR